MNLTNPWLTYERKRAVFEKKWIKTMRPLLNQQVKQYVNTYKAGQSNPSAVTPYKISEALLSLYGDVGGYFAGTTNRELGGQALKPVNSQRVAVLHKQRDTRLDVSRLKSGSLGFSLDWASIIIEKLRATALLLAQRITNTTIRKITSILQAAQLENLSIDDTAKRIVSEMEDMNLNRALTIVRTETGRAAGLGKMQGAKALGVELQKEWVSARDNRTRRTKEANHWILNGQRRGMEEPFSDGHHELMQPGDPNAPLSETANCRCTTIFTVKKDIDGNPIKREYLTV